MDVVLDPDTAHPNIMLSSDGKQAGRGEVLHVVPDKPQRFDPVICVLSKKGFQSGRFYYQVDQFEHPQTTTGDTLFTHNLFCELGCSWKQDFLGPGRGQRVRQQEGYDHFNPGERLLDGAFEERQ